MSKENVKDEKKPVGGSEPTFIRKITSKHVVGKPSVPTKSVMLWKVYGEIRGFLEEESEHGPFIKLKGDFEAINMETGEIFVAPFCIVPAPLDQALATMYLNAVEGEDKQKKAEFAAEIGVKPSPIPAGYEWITKPLIKMRTSNVLLGLRDQVAKLEAPKS